MDKKRVVKDFALLPTAIQDRVIAAFPEGYSGHLIKFTDKTGKKVNGLPFETEEIYYLVRIPSEFVYADDWGEAFEMGLVDEEDQFEYSERLAELLDNDDEEDDDEEDF